MRQFATRLGLALSEPGFRFLCLFLLGLPFFLMYTQAALVVPWTHDTQWDFRPAWLAAAKLAHGATPYTPTVLAGRFDAVFGVPYVYPPLEAWLLQPLTVLPYQAAARAWLLFDQALMVALLVLLGKILELTRAEQWLVLAIVLFSSSLLQGEIQIGQLNLLLTVLIACWLAMYRAARVGGLVPLGLAIALKLYPSPQVLVPLMRRRWKLAAGIVVVVLALSVVTPSYTTQYFTQVFPHVSGVGELRENTSLGATITRIFDPPAIAVSAVWVAVAATASVLAVVFIRRLADDVVGRVFAVLIMLGATPFLSPLMEYGHLVPLTLVAFVGVPLAWRSGRRPPAMVIAIAWCVISYHHLFYGSWGGWAWGVHAWESSGGLAAAVMYAGVLVAAPSRQRAKA
ncbi:MAG: hypothetical protein NVSMB17_09780 [Candidatus Dormibacteria bacterium]